MGDIEEILCLAMKKNVSEIHLQAGLPPVLRVLKALYDRSVITEDDALERAFDAREMARARGRRQL